VIDQYDVNGISNRTLWRARQEKVYRFPDSFESKDQFGMQIELVMKAIDILQISLPLYHSLEYSTKEPFYPKAMKN